MGMRIRMEWEWEWEWEDWDWDFNSRKEQESHDGTDFYIICRYLPYVCHTHEYLTYFVKRMIHSDIMNS